MTGPTQDLNEPGVQSQSVSDLPIVLPSLVRDIENMWGAAYGKQPHMGNCQAGASPFWFSLAPHLWSRNVLGVPHMTRSHVGPQLGHRHPLKASLASLDQSLFPRGILQAWPGPRCPAVASMSVTG